MTFETGLFIVFLFYLSVFLLSIAGPVYRALILPHRSIQVQADHAERRWREERRAAGLSAEEIEMERYLRQSLADIQEQGSDAVYRNDGDIDQQLNDIATVQITSLTYMNADWGRALTNALKGLHKEDLLYPDAVRELARQYSTEERARPQDWTPVRSCSGRRPTDEELRKRALVQLSAFTTRSV